MKKDLLGHVRFGEYSIFISQHSNLITPTHYPILIFLTHKFSKIYLQSVWIEILSSISIQKLNFEVKLWDLRKLLLNKMHKTTTVSRGVQRVEDLTNPPESDRPEAQRVDLKSMAGRIRVYL